MKFLCGDKKNDLEFLIHKGLTYLKAFLTKRGYWSINALVFFMDFPAEEGICDLGKRKKKESNNKNVAFPLGERQSVVKPLVYG